MIATERSARTLPNQTGDLARVMICDDSAVIRSAISRILESDPGITVLSRVANGQLAIEAVARIAVDVLVLDIEMPVLDGLSALPLLLRADPGLRIIMASTLTLRGADIAMRALRLGAADYVPKPSAGAVTGDASFAAELVAKVKGLAKLRRRAAGYSATSLAVTALAAMPPAVVALRPPPARAPLLLAIGSSTGGPQALLTLVQSLGSTLPVPVVLTQHMPPMFTAMLAEHITRLGALPCAEARDGELLEPGRIYLAPGDRHLLVTAAGQRLQARLSDDAAENFCRPSVDPMLRTASTACNGRVLVAMLTGMGQDGMAGTQGIVAAGGTAVAQDEATSVVWGMPGAIARAGLCHAVLPLPQLGAKIRALLQAKP